MASRAGSTNKNKSALIKLLQSKYPGYQPVISMADIAFEAHADGNLQLAGDMHNKVAQYVTPRLKAIEHTGNVDNTISVTVVHE